MLEVAFLYEFWKNHIQVNSLVKPVEHSISISWKLQLYIGLEKIRMQVRLFPF